MNFYAEAIWRDIKRNAAHFWYVPTIDAMQAEMLRGVKARNQCNLFFRALCRQTAVFAKEFGVRMPDLRGRKFEDCFGTPRDLMYEIDCINQLLGRTE